MNTLLATDEFNTWLQKLRDLEAKARILARLKAAEFGNFGDWKSLGGRILEMRIAAGPGYRIYYARQGVTVYQLLNGGNKSTQARDIQKAKQILAQLI